MSGYDYGAIDEEACIRAVQESLCHGINVFDVADVYGFGRGEQLLSDGLGEMRKQVIIASKIGLRWDAQGRVTRDLSKAYALQAIDGSLRRLRLESLTLCQLHWPDPKTPREETAEALRACLQAGKIQHIGVCNCSIDEAREWVKLLPIDTIQIPYNLLCREAEIALLAWCREQGLSVIAHSGLARGFLAGNYRSKLEFGEKDTRQFSRYFSMAGYSEKVRLLDALSELTGIHGRPESSIALRWVLENPNISTVLVGIKNERQLKANLLCVDWNLTCEEYSHLSKLSMQCPGSMDGWFAGKANQTEQVLG